MHFSMARGRRRFRHRARTFSLPQERSDIGPASQARQAAFACRAKNSHQSSFQSSQTLMEQTMAPEFIVYLVVGLLIFGSVFGFVIRLLVGYAAFKQQKAFLEDYQRRVAEAAAQVPQMQP